MIKANELRIGNFLNVINRAHIVVTAEHIKSIAEGDKDYHPIPLTPEWLERCGFRDGEIRPSYKLHMDVRPYETATQGVFPGEWAVTLVDTVPHQLGHTIRYVHQLQNLYFALTGEELKIEL